MEGYRFTHPIQVRFRDLDALGHVNNAVYLTYFEAARMAYWMHVNGRTDLRSMDMILARAEVDYRAPVGFGDELEVGVRCASVKRSSFVLEQALVDRRTGKLVAQARKVLVHYDYAAGRSKPLTEDQRQLLMKQDPGLVIEV
jgi:acyl-CoA thioester hydrolase